MSDVDRYSDTTLPVDELSTNALFAVLRHRRRRDALSYLLEGRDEATLEELAAAVASRGRAPSDQRLARVSIDLHHVHLPELADAGLLRYDPETETVESLEYPPGVTAILERLDGESG